MAINAHITHFAGKAVENWEPQSGIRDPENTCYALRLSSDEWNEGWQWTDKFAAFLDDPLSSRVYGIVIGYWGAPNLDDTEYDENEYTGPDWEFFDQYPGLIVEALVAARDRLPNLRAIFFGDVSEEEYPMTLLPQRDLSPLFTAYPKLEHFGARGGDGLSLGSLKHDRLKSLVIQSDDQG
jgi:hypothetical protein